MKSFVTDYNFKTIEVVEQIPVTSHEQIQQELEKAVANGWEGLMLRKDGFYEGERSKNLLKVRAFIDREFEVKSIVTGPFQIVNTKTNCPETITTMTSVMIEYKGCEVSVGSGFSLEQRKQFFTDPSLIVGKNITVKYFSESRNEQGGYSLRFPIFKYLCGEERDI